MNIVNKIIILEAQSQDEAFLVASQMNMAFETEGMSLEKEKVKSGVRKILEKPCLGKYYIASVSKREVGCLLIQYEWSDWRN